MVSRPRALVLKEISEICMEVEACAAKKHASEKDIIEILANIHMLRNLFNGLVKTISPVNRKDILEKASKLYFKSLRKYHLKP